MRGAAQLGAVRRRAHGARCMHSRPERVCGPGALRYETGWQHKQWLREKVEACSLPEVRRAALSSATDDKALHGR